MGTFDYANDPKVRASVNNAFRRLRSALADIDFDEDITINADLIVNGDGIIDGDLHVTGDFTVGGAGPITRYQTGFCEGGEVSGSSWADGARVTFPQEYPAGVIPKVRLIPNGYPEMRRAFWTGPFNPGRPAVAECIAVDVDETGFDPRGRWVQNSGAFTPVSDNFDAGTVAGVSQNVECDLSVGGAHLDRYTPALQITSSAGGDPGDVGAGIAAVFGTSFITLRIDYNDGGGWVTGTPFTQSVSGYNNDTVVYTLPVLTIAPGLGAADRLRVFCTDHGVGPLGGQASCDPGATTYSTPAGDSFFASMTPDAANNPSDRLVWEAFQA